MKGRIWHFIKLYKKKNNKISWWFNIRANTDSKHENTIFRVSIVYSIDLIVFKMYYLEKSKT